jgi:hypothetical protein
MNFSAEFVSFLRERTATVSGVLMALRILRDAATGETIAIRRPDGTILINGKPFLGLGFFV